MTFVESFKQYLADTRLTFSYKPVLVLALLDAVNAQGIAARADVIARFHAFYLARQQQGLAAEKSREIHPSPLISPYEVSEVKVWQIIARYPLPLMDAYIVVDGETIRFKSALWQAMQARDLVELREIARQRIEAYFEDVG